MRSIGGGRHATRDPGQKPTLSSRDRRLRLRRLVTSPRAPRWVIPFAVVLVLVAGASVAAWSSELPYYAFSPGPVGDALGSVETAAQVTVYPTEDGLFLLTVSAQEVNPFELVAAITDPTVDVVRRERVRPPNLSDQEFRERGLSQMDQATETAISEALRVLGDRTDARPAGIEVVDVLREDGLFLAGDQVVGVDGRSTVMLDDLRRALAGLGPGDTVEVEVLRDGASTSFALELIPSPDDPAKPLLGIVARTRFPISITTENIGGPSAGLMYTLAIIDLLGPGDLAKGHVIAGTGTISPGGEVGPIGGVRQKVVAAEAAGATVMLVPEANYQEALTAPRSRMELVPVSTLDQALRFLSELPE